MKASIEDVVLVVSLLTDEQQQLLKDTINYGAWGDGVPVYNLKDRVSNGHYSTVTAKELNEVIGHKVFIEQ